jgi:DNA-binding CsgD family transcriptional regulator
MTNDPTPLTPAPDVRAQRRARRATRIARRERYFSLMASGYTCNQIAKMVRTSAATVRREVDRALAERRLDAPERFAQVQVARLVKALRLAEAAIELGELKAVATYLRVVAALDRYHELAAGSPPPPRRSTKAPPLALPAPPEALTFAAPPASNEPDAAEVAGDPADGFPQ